MWDMPCDAIRSELGRCKSRSAAVLCDQAPQLQQRLEGLPKPEGSDESAMAARGSSVDWAYSTYDIGTRSTTGSCSRR
jgi:hypothetical protein